MNDKDWNVFSKIYRNIKILRWMWVFNLFNFNCVVDLFLDVGFQPVEFQLCC